MGITIRVQLSLPQAIYSCRIYEKVDESLLKLNQKKVQPFYRKRCQTIFQAFPELLAEKVYFG